MANNFGPVKPSIANFPIKIDLTDFRINADLIKASTFRFARQLGDMNWPLRQSVKLVIIPSMMANFMVGGRPTWEGLAEETILWKIKNFPAQNAFIPLWRTGNLHEKVEGGYYWRFTRESADMEMLDSVVSYAKFHQRGTRHMPARPFAVLQQKDIERIVVIFDSWIMKMTSMKDFWPYKHKEF